MKVNCENENEREKKNEAGKNREKIEQLSFGKQ